MSLFDSLVLFAVMAGLALVPSTSVALVVARTSTAGFASGAAVAVGIVLGDLGFVFLAILGMAALAEIMGGFFLVLKYLAGAYLIWFGVGLMRSRSPSRKELRGVSTQSLWASFLSGLIITLGDIKAIFFYASLFPMFVDLRTIGALDIATIVAVTLIAVGGVKLGYAYAARKVVSLVGGFGMERGVRISAGGFMVGAGIYVAAKT